MQEPEKTRREFALLWEVFWPCVGATFGTTMGGVVGIGVGGLGSALLLALIGALIGLEIGQFLGEFAKLFFLPWFELLRGGKSGPVTAGVAAAGLAAIWAVQAQAGVALAVFMACSGFICGAWLVILVRLLVELAYRRWLRA